MCSGLPERKIIEVYHTDPHDYRFKTHEPIHEEYVKKPNEKKIIVEEDPEEEVIFEKEPGKVITIKKDYHNNAIVVREEPYGIEHVINAEDLKLGLAHLLKQSLIAFEDEIKYPPDVKEYLEKSEEYYKKKFYKEKAKLLLKIISKIIVHLIKDLKCKGKGLLFYLLKMFVTPIEPI